MKRLHDTIVAKYIDWFYRIPILGDLVFYAFYSVAKVMRPVTFLVAGGQRLEFGTCVIWTTRHRKQAILNGIECLQTRDPDLFLSIATARKGLTFFYSPINTKSAGGRVYGLDEQFLKWGPEGIATSMVDSFFQFKASPRINRIRLSSQEAKALRDTPQEVLEWMRQHEIQQNLISAFGMMSAKWSAQKYFAEKIPGEPAKGSRSV